MVVQMICNNDFWFAGSVFPRVEYDIPGMGKVNLDTLSQFLRVWLVYPYVWRKSQVW